MRSDKAARTGGFQFFNKPFGFVEECRNCAAALHGRSSKTIVNAVLGPYMPPSVSLYAEACALRTSRLQANLSVLAFYFFQKFCL